MLEFDLLTDPKPLNSGIPSAGAFEVVLSIPAVDEAGGVIGGGVLMRLALVGDLRVFDAAVDVFSGLIDLARSARIMVIHFHP